MDGNWLSTLRGIGRFGTTQRYMHLTPAALDAAIRRLESSGVPLQRGDILETDARQRGKMRSPATS